MLVDQIVTIHWRWRRALKAESDEIALSVDRVRRKENLAAHELAALWGTAPDPVAPWNKRWLGFVFWESN